MSQSKTVFIVGAGASVEFGLPVGGALKAHISKMLSTAEFNGERVKDNYIDTAIRQAEYSVRPPPGLGKMVQAAGQIADGLPLVLSIDNYLHTHNGNKAIELCGKLAIVRAILAAESNSNLFKKSADRLPIDFVNCENAWLVPFMRLLSEDCNIERLAERLATVTFIVFNYDRCIEHFLFNAIKVVYNVTDEKSAELVSGMAIYHPYGMVGELSWMPWDGNDVEPIDFGGMPTPEKFLALGKH